MSGAPKNPFCTAQLALPFRDPPGEPPGVVGRLLALAEAQGGGEIVGPEGTGKSTLLRALHEELERRGAPVVRLLLKEGGWPALVRLREALASVEQERARWLLVDSAERLPAVVRWLLWRYLRSRRVALVATGHRRLGLPPLRSTRIDPELARSLTGYILTRSGEIPALVGEEEVLRALRETGGNLREAFLWLYDRYEERWAARNDASHSHRFLATLEGPTQSGGCAQDASYAPWFLAGVGGDRLRLQGPDRGGGGGDQRGSGTGGGERAGHPGKIGGLLEAGGDLPDRARGGAWRGSEEGEPARDDHPEAGGRFSAEQADLGDGAGTAEQRGEPICTPGDGAVCGGEAEAATDVAPLCMPGFPQGVPRETCKAGACVPVAEDLEKAPDFEEAQVFSLPGACFNRVTCGDARYTIPVATAFAQAETEDCSLSLEELAAQVPQSGRRTRPASGPSSTRTRRKVGPSRMKPAPGSGSPGGSAMW